MKQTMCTHCGSRFFCDKEDYFKEKPYCSYCFPFLQECVVCGEIKVLKNITTNDFGICKKCEEHYGTIRNSFGSRWLFLRFLTFTRDEYRCRYCGRSPLQDNNVILHCDHIIPKSKGGEDKLSNLITSCLECNEGKIDVMLEKHIQLLLINRRTKNGNIGDNQSIKRENDKMENGEIVRCKLANNTNVGKGSI